MGIVQNYKQNREILSQSIRLWIIFILFCFVVFPFASTEAIST